MLPLWIVVCAASEESLFLNPLGEARFHARARVRLDDPLLHRLVDSLIEFGDLRHCVTLARQRLFEIENCALHRASTAQVENPLAEGLAVCLFCRFDYRHMSEHLTQKYPLCNKLDIGCPTW